MRGHRDTPYLWDAVCLARHGINWISLGDVFIQGPGKYNNQTVKVNDNALGSNQDKRGELSFPADTHQKTSSHNPKNSNGYAL